MRVVFRPEAQEELLEAKAWYEARADGLGMDFARAFESALLNALRRPEAHPVVQDELRRVLLRRFPYALFLPGAGRRISCRCGLPPSPGSGFDEWKTK
ncbi:MAG: hypothetical protein ACK520_13725, partial [Inhella sp.]